MKEKIIFIVGPTAAGKSEAAAYLAKKINAEVISCDSMQLYKGMDIITSKPSPKIRKSVAHHLIDAVSPLEEYNVSQYRRDALRKIREVLKRGKTPLFAGGTGLYMSILIDGIFKVKSQDKSIRDRLYKQAETRGSENLYRKLQEIDPDAAGKIHPNDTRRLVRALEVFEVTGKTISVLQKQRRGLSGKYEVRIFCLDMPRDRLYKRINERVDKMFASGVAEEAEKLLKSKLSKTASSAIGLKELKGHFDGLYPLEQAKELMKRNTRAYSKRQLTWFRKDKRIKWIEVGEREKPAAVANRILNELKRQR